MNHVESNAREMALQAEKIGYPVMIKAAAGGGGKEMRIVKSGKNLRKECEAASSEAFSAFGDGTIYLEKYLSGVRHVEIQILADAHGNTIHLLERECSIQRRQQKIIEETPSPVLTSELRESMGQAAVEAAKLAEYVNAGTVEFLLDNMGNYYFLEINPRLQVEHPITEMITDIDIVQQQIKVADGQKLAISQDDISGRGHAIECRIYAEDPENNFFPSSGEISFINMPTGPGIRNDCGVYAGFIVPIEYDPILSKLTVHAQNRDTAIQRMVNSLLEYVILGVKTSIPFLLDIFKSEPFKAGKTSTDFIEQHFTDWKAEGQDADIARIAFIVDEIMNIHGKELSMSDRKQIFSPWKTLGNWRL
mmetsp:Transcript_8383/g.4511  ORF Transcript_8383/g.4511 Transcript_8383/m.4511 type:complete len:363 (+) Transcript_8383:1257-2345(+)